MGRGRRCVRLRDRCAGCRSAVVAGRAGGGVGRRLVLAAEPCSSDRSALARRAGRAAALATLETGRGCPGCWFGRGSSGSPARQPSISAPNQPIENPLAFDTTAWRCGDGGYALVAGAVVASLRRSSCASDTRSGRSASSFAGSAAVSAWRSASARSGRSAGACSLRIRSACDRPVGASGWHRGRDPQVPAVRARSRRQPRPRLRRDDGRRGRCLRARRRPDRRNALPRGSLVLSLTSTASSPSLSAGPRTRAVRERAHVRRAGRSYVALARLGRRLENSWALMPCCPRWSRRSARPCGCHTSRSRSAATTSQRCTADRRGPTPLSARAPRPGRRRAPARAEVG